VGIKKSSKKKRQTPTTGVQEAVVLLFLWAVEVSVAVEAVLAEVLSVEDDSEAVVQVAVSNYKNNNIKEHI
jgi:hypothetical protein